MHTSFFTITIVTQISTALVIIFLVLLQHGKGADMGITFSSSVSGSLFGVTGSSNFLSKLTGLAAVLFFIATLALTFCNKNLYKQSSTVMKNFSGLSTTSINSHIKTSPINNGIDQSSQIPK